VLVFVLATSLLLQGSPPAPQASVARPRTIAIDEAFAERAHLKIGDTVTVSSRPGTAYAPGELDVGGPAPAVETVVIGAIVKRGADPAEIARGDLRVRMHLDQIQRIAGYGDRVDRFAIATTPSADVARTIDRINHVAFGFGAYRSRDIAVETSRTFQVVSRFHRAFGVITIVASSVFLLCIMVL
jgi:putative ABC transport system permease protein